eukprot:comp18962_c0_seq1/m.21236 comp18962_c0_seq1/g.21236  ORF comp18962_c0_seq1/g.21236 comp18962_c0_seq1/m.21236 type:complete len:184 (-) comp18962_c0_seq1:599-1150(-)
MPVDAELHKVAYKGDLNDLRALVSELQDSGELDINVRGAQNRTPFMRAAGSADIPVLQYLVEQGADPMLKDAAGRTCLHWAAMSGNARVITWLVEKGCDVNAATNSGTTPLHGAAQEGHEEAVAVLLTHNADKTLLAEGKTALQMAKENNHMGVVAKLGGGGGKGGGGGGGGGEKKKGGCTIL